MIFKFSKYIVRKFKLCLAEINLDSNLLNLDSNLLKLDLGLEIFYWR
jgi:hypothetical protein